MGARETAALPPGPTAMRRQPLQAGLRLGPRPGGLASVNLSADVAATGSGVWGHGRGLHSGDPSSAWSHAGVSSRPLPPDLPLT